MARRVDTSTGGSELLEGVEPPRGHGGTRECKQQQLASICYINCVAELMAVCIILLISY